MVFLFVQNCKNTVQAVQQCFGQPRLGKRKCRGMASSNGFGLGWRRQWEPSATYTKNSTRVRSCPSGSLKLRIRLAEKLVMPTAAIWSATSWLAMKFFHHGSVAMSTASSRESSAHRFSAVHAAVCAASRRGPSSCARTACSPATSMRIAQRRGGGALGTMVSMARRGCTALSVCAVRGESTARHKAELK